jgi:hypothetical protein
MKRFNLHIVFDTEMTLQPTHDGIGSSSTEIKLRQEKNSSDVKWLFEIHSDTQHFCGYAWQ